MKKINSEQWIAGCALAGMLLLFGSYLFGGPAYILTLILLVGVMAAVLVCQFSWTAAILRRISAFLLCAAMTGSMVFPAYASGEVQGYAEKGNGRDLATYLRDELALAVETYQLTPEMTDDDLANVYFSLDSQASRYAWDNGNQLMEDAAGLSAEEAALLEAEENTQLCLRFYNIMERIVNDVPMTIGISGTLSDGLSATGASSLDWTLSTNQITVSAETKASGCPTTYTPSEDTLTLTSTVVGTLNVTSLEVSGKGTVTINSGSVSTGYTGQFPLGGDNQSVALYIKSDSSSDTTTLKLTYEFIPSGNITVSFQPVSGVSYTVNDTQVTDTEQEVTGDPSVGFTITPSNSKYILTGGTLVDADGNTSTLTAVDGKLSPKVGGSLTPTFAYDEDGDGIAPFLVGALKYWDWDSAMTAAGGSGTVILNDDYTLPARDDDYVVEDGVTFLVPFDDANTVIKNDMENYILKQDISGHELYRKLTMASGASICVNGTLCIGSRAARQMVGQVGPYGAIYMNSGSSISIENGATMYAYGYIFPGASGAGTVTVQSGGTVYEDLMVMDYPGSASSTSDLYYDSSIFPMRTFTARNVEVSMTLVHGAKEYVFYHFYGTTAGYNGDYVLLIGEASESNPSPFSLGAGASLTKSYVNGKQIIVVNGDSSVNAIAIKIKSYVTVSSSDTSGFPLPSGFDVSFDNGTVTLGDNLIMTEGSKITIGKNAILETNGKNLYVLDSSDPGAYSATDVHGTTYSPVNSDAILDINGVLNAGSSFYTATNGACVTSSGGSGQVNITAAATATNSVTIKSGKSGASTINLVSAKLKNADGKTPAFTDTSSATEATTYSYIDGVWQNCKRLDIVATNIAVNAGLDVNFYVNAADMVEGQTYTAVVKKHFAETIPNVPNPVEEEYISTSWFTPSQNTSFRGFRFDDVSAKEMTDKIEARIYINYGTENQMQVSNTYTETIQNYAVRTLVSEDVKTSVGADKFAKLQTALIDMLNYGATAQLYFKYNEENLANVDTEDTAGIISDHSGRASAKFDFDSWADPRDTSAFSTSFAGSSVSAKNQFMFTFYFYMDDSSGKTATIKVNDKEFTTISGDSFYDRKPGELYGVDVTGMSIVDANLLMECTVTDDTTGEVIGKANDSVLGYAKRMYEKTSEKIYEEMMKFAYSASLYFGNTWANGGT